MEQNLSKLVRDESLAAVWATLNTLAYRQQAEATTGLKFFKKAPVQMDGEMTKERFWAMTKEERLLWQRSKEEERRQLNVAAGIDGSALLTKENVELWRSQGLTFAAIARDILGVSQEAVAAAVKSHGRQHPIQNIIKRRNKL